MTQTNQSELLMKTWAESQQSLLTNWLETVQDSGAPSGTMMWNQLLDVWQTSVQQTLETQSRWLRDWMENISNSTGNSAEMQKQVQQGQELLLSWTEAQRQFWQAWFDAVKSQSAGSSSKTGMQAGQDLLNAWQESVRKMITMQTEWIQRWTMNRVSDKVSN